MEREITLTDKEYWFGKLKKVLEMDDSGSYTTMWMYLILVNCALKNGWSGKFYDTYIFHNKTKPKKYIVHLGPQGGYILIGKTDK